MWAAEVPADTSAKQFAVTIEPFRGAVQPTGQRVLLGGMRINRRERVVHMEIGSSAWRRRYQQGG